MRMNRKEFLKLAGGAALGPVLGRSRSRDDLPNVILIVSDDQPYHELGILNPALKTPNLDGLARAGVRFSHTFCNTSLCMPARANILTGLWSRQNGIVTNETGSSLRKEQILVPYLKEAGYVTGFTGKWHFNLGNTSPARVGFDWEGSVLPTGEIGARSPIYRPYGKDEKEVEVTKEDADRVFTDTALSFIERNRDNRFFLWLAYVSPHAPYRMPEKFLNLDRSEDLRLPSNYLFEPRVQKRHGMPVLPQGLDRPQREQAMKKILASHYGLVSYMDEQIGRVLELMDRLQISGKTMVIFIGDNGFMLGSQGLIGKAYMYEESIRVPLLMSWPGRIRPAVCDELVYNMDLLPTVMDLAGLPIPHGLAGKSLFPLLQGKKRELRKEIFCEWYPLWDPMEAVRTRQWKYIHTPELGDELYNLADDPYERKNLAGEARYGGVLARLKEARRRWTKEVGEVRANVQQSEIDAYVRELKARNYDAGSLNAVGVEKMVNWVLKLQGEGRIEPDGELVKRIQGAQAAYEAKDLAGFQSALLGVLQELVRCEEAGKPSGRRTA